VTFDCVTVDQISVERGLLKVEGVGLLEEFNALLLDSMDVDSEELRLTLLNLFQAL
jgi:hypothetical protein